MQQNQLLVEDMPINAVDLMITEKCNLDCTYCFHNKTPQTMDLETGKKILDRLHTINPNRMVITFFGGEPLLYPQLVLDLAKYARELWKAIEDPTTKEKQEIVGFTLSTNGTYFDKDMFEEYKKLGLGVQISIDGDKQTTTMYRKGIDFDKVINNITEILKIMPRTNVRMTYTPETVGRLAQNVMFLHQIGINDIMHHAVIEADWTKEAAEQYMYQLKEIYHYRRYVNKRGGNLSIYFVDKCLRTLNDEQPPEINFCGAGKDYVALMPNGDVYPCHRASSNRHIIDFKLGNILSDSDPIIRGIFLNIDKQSVGCTSKCPASKTCHACIITNYLVNKELMKPIDKYCNLCLIESTLAQDYLKFELYDKNERRFDAISNVLADLSEQNVEFRNIVADALLKDKEEKK